MVKCYLQFVLPTAPIFPRFNQSAYNLSVLVAEDHPTNRKLARLQLQELGCTVDTALNGREAVDKVTRNRYSLVLMDCQMPEMDGFRATQQIRALEEPIQRHTPIIAMTAQTTAEDRVRCLESGRSGT